jgi:uncharacterized phage-like protein YoqJ
MNHPIFAFTGHRPNKLGGYRDEVLQGLVKFAKEKLQEAKPGHCITGMALGWDTAVAIACVDLGIPWTAAVPFPGQQSIWPLDDQVRWTELIRKATVVEFVSEEYSVSNLQKRNEWMVDHGDYVIALHDGSTGGTYNCIKYAKKVKKPVINWWADYHFRQTPLNVLLS